ncbi:hypothetical protein GUF39_08295, partial [Xanthomonas citri pv. citri]|nr:hypothetical protein [Xanthomonas citri pv. citri]
MIKIVLEALGEVFGGLLGAIALTFLLWNVFKLVRHPEWGPWLALLFIGLAIATSVHMG